MAFLALVLVIAAAGPVVFFSASDIWANASGAVSSVWSKITSGSDKVEPKTPADALALSPPQLLLEGIPERDIADAFRFDVSTGWVMRNWPRVSTGLAQLRLQGYRVPLVTGTAEDDLAGSLTYYFNSQQQVQQIAFYGTTGNASKLIRFLTTRYGFVRRRTNDASLFLYEVVGSDGKLKSELRVRPARVIKSSDPLQRFEVALVMERPEKG